MSAAPPSSAVPETTDGLTVDEVNELADAYLELLRMMTKALEECDHGYGFFDWSGHGFRITGHPPTELVERLRA